MQEFTAVFFPSGKPKLPFSWPVGTLNLASFNPIPKKFRPGRTRNTGRPRGNSKFKKADEAATFGGGGSSGSGGVVEGVTRLQTSFNPLDAVRSLRRHRWRPLDLQYLVLTGFCLFSLAIAPHAPVAKSLAVLGTVLVLAMPATRQFFLPSWPIWTYLLYFFCSR